MDVISLDHPILKIEKKSVDLIRKKYGFSDMENLKEAVNILKEWIQKHEFIKNKKFDPLRLEKHIITSKGSLERPKREIETICTQKTLTPKHFKPSIVEDTRELMEYVDLVGLPQTTEDWFRVIVFRLKKTVFTPRQMHICWNNMINIGAHFKEHDYVDGFIIIFDLYKQNMVEFMKHVNLVELQQTLSILTKGFGMRIIKFYIITDSKMAEMGLYMIKQIVSKKVADKAEIITTPKELLDRLSRKVMPRDYGGDEQSICELNDRYVKILLSKEHTDFMEESNLACTDESLRSDKNSLNRKNIDMNGTFRTLNID